MVLGQLGCFDLLALGDSDWRHPNHLSAYSKLVAYLGHPVHIFVGVRCLFCQNVHTGCPDHHSSTLKRLLEVSAPPFSPSCRSAHEASRTVGSGTKAEFHGLGCSDEDPAARSHATWNENRLTNFPVFSGNLGIARGERSSGSLSVDNDLSHLSINFVGLKLGNVVGDIIDYLHV